MISRLPEVRKGTLKVLKVVLINSLWVIMELERASSIPYIIGT